MILSLDVPSLPESLNVLCNLRTLHLNILKLGDMSWIGCLRNLELLSISTPSLTGIPKEMGQLGNLRLLDLRNMSIAYIPPGVLSRMLKLEELYFPFSFQRWGCRAKELDDYEEWESWEDDASDDKERTCASNNQIKRVNASISEIQSISLHALEISIPNTSLLPKNSSIFKNIRRFKIFVPNNLRYKKPGNFYSTNMLQLTGDAYDIQVSGICNLMSRTEDLSLMKVRNLKNIMFQLQDYGFPKLQKMIISECDELEHVVDTTTRKTLPEDDCLFSKLETLHLSMLPNLKAILDGRLASLQRFENLSQISIRFCHKMKYVFPLSIVRGSLHLKSIQILDCIEMDGIFYQDKEDDKDLVHYSIEELYFHSLPKLVGFLLHLDDEISGFHDKADQSRTTNEILSSSMEGSICTLDKSRGNSEDSSTMNKDVIRCTEKYVAFTSSKLTEKLMQDLKRLEITFCDALQIIFLFEENHVIARAFNSLMELKLFGLRNLEHIWFQVPPEMIAFQNLQLLVLSGCHNMYLFSPHVAKLLVQLRKIYINQCEKMEEVILKENEEESVDKIVFPRLQFLEFEHIPNLKVFYRGIHAVELPLLEFLKFNQCNKVENFSYKSAMTPMLKGIQINGSLCALTGDLNSTIMRYTRNCFGTPANDDNPSSTINSYSPDDQDSSNELHCNPDKLDGSHELHNTSDDLDGSNELQCTPDEMDGSEGPYTTLGGPYELHNTPHFDGDFDGYEETELPDNTTNASEANEEANHSYMKEFTFADLKIATNNFSSDALLGKGGFGYVYKGWLDEMTFSPSKTCTGMAVAIKKLKPNTEQGFHEWQSEVYFLERLWHPNLIKLLGYCREDEELLLVYEFMRNGSLNNHLFRRNLEIESLSWELRLKIAIGAAQGLALLHTLKKEVIYRDFNPSNILLDGNYNAKLSDFGLAKLGPSGGDSHVSTRSMGTYGYASPEYPATDWDADSHVSTRVKGTYGYAAPEYIATGHFYVKSDVYGFGVVLLELITGLRAIDRNRPGLQKNLIEWVKPYLSNKRRLKNVIDPRIEGQYSSKAMMLAAQLSLKCITADPKRRPSMSEAVEALEQIYAIKEKPKGGRKLRFLKFHKVSL